MPEDREAPIHFQVMAGRVGPAGAPEPGIYAQRESREEGRPVPPHAVETVAAARRGAVLVRVDAWGLTPSEVRARWRRLARSAAEG